MAQFTKQFMTDGKFDYKKIMEHRMQGQLEPLTEEPDNEQFTQEVKTAEAKSQGKGKKAEVAKPSVQAVKNEEVEMYDADAVNGVSVETLGEEKKWIAGAIKKPGALHKALGVPEGEKIPAEKLEKAAKEPGKMGQRARLAKTLKSLRKESLERIEEAELTPKQEKIAKIAGDPHKIDQHDLKALRGGHQMKEEVEELEEEQLDELKKSTLASYTQKAHKEQMYMARHPEPGVPKHIAAKESQKRERGIATAVKKLAKEEVEQIEERELTPAETKKKEEVVKSMKKKLPGFKERYGERAKEVMYAVATKIAKKD